MSSDFPTEITSPEAPPLARARCAREVDPRRAEIVSSPRGVGRAYLKTGDDPIRDLLAEREAEDEVTWVLTPQSAQVLSDLMGNPPAPAPALVSAWREAQKNIRIVP